MSLPSSCGDDAVAGGCAGAATDVPGRGAQKGGEATDPSRTGNKSERSPEGKNTP
ncbi:MAG: hypothetical protein KTR25_20210 [Myxococcales bacterium]|nr:hypothetical protein [Myxococcales bacterium]